MKLTQAELIAECRRRFGDDPTTWAFVCPNCGDVARSGDFPQGSKHLGQQCVGRALGALSARSGEAWKARGGRGCNWCAFGLIGGPWTIVMPDGREVGSFALWDPE